MTDSSVQPRPHCYDSDYYQWAFQRIPVTVDRGGVEVPNPARDSAVFVVHGMGQQGYPDTAVQLRDGFEAALAEVQPQAGGPDLPTPYILDGYWANYDDFEHTFPEEWAWLSAGERAFFTKLWQRRTRSALRAARWLAWQGWRLVADANVREKTSRWRWFTYLWLVFLAWVGVAYLLVRHPAILADVLGDVRLYTQPNGQVQHVIVQRIERHVGEVFLRLLGLNWDLRTLPADQQLHICGQPHRFRFVTWVAHSLGSVVSYNVIADLLMRCEEKRQLLKVSGAALSPEERSELEGNIQRVEQGLHRFITIGSPLEKFATLFPEVLRECPASLKQRCLDKGRRWWVNVFHIWDVVSGRLLDSKFFPRVENLHSKLWRIPLLAHTSYWHDNLTCTYIVSRTYGREILTVTTKTRDFLPPDRVDAYRALSLIVIAPLVIGVACVLLYGVGWLAAHPDIIWKPVWGGLRTWLGIGALTTS